jgi:hypothetical protein
VDGREAAVQARPVRLAPTPAPHEAAAFADRAVTALKAAVAAGWADAAELKETDFDPLRGRDDFQKLLAEVEAKAGPEDKPKD